MPNTNVSFGGGTLIIPGAYYQDQIQNFVNTGTPTPPVIVLGYGYGGAPQTLYSFASAMDFMNAVRGGPVSAFIPFLFNPGPSIGGASTITYINVGENTQSTYSVSGVGGVVANITSVDYGLPSNQIQIQISPISVGSLTAVNATIYDGYSGQEVIGNYLGVPMQLAYTGTATGGVSYSASYSGLSVSSPNSGESFSVNFGNYQTVSSVIEYLNGTGFYSANTLSSTNGAMPSSGLISSNSALPSPSGNAYAFVGVPAQGNDFVYWLNTSAANLVQATIGNLANWPPFGTGFQHFTGAQSIPPTNADYANAFNLALTTPGWVIFVVVEYGKNSGRK